VSERPAEDEAAVTPSPPARPAVLGSDAGFYAVLGLLAALYVGLVLAMLAADLYYAAQRPTDVFSKLWTPEIRYSTWLSLISCTITTILALWVGVPIGYLMSRRRFPGKAFIDGVLDIPIFLPPLVVGLSLLILFRKTPFVWFDDAFSIALHVPAVMIAQFAVAAAFAVRTLRQTFDEIPPRCEQVAMTLGCTRNQAFWRVVLPEAKRGILTAATLCWARALGEFGPVLVFAGSTRGRTEVLPVSVHMELSIGNIEGALGVSLLMVVIALAVLFAARSLGDRGRALEGYVP
jgi:molybdate transport system permease protein